LSGAVLLKTNRSLLLLALAVSERAFAFVALRGLFLPVGVSNSVEEDHCTFLEGISASCSGPVSSWSALGLLAEAVLCPPVGLPGSLWRLAASCNLSSSRVDGWPAGFSWTGDLRSFELLLNAPAASVPLSSFLLLNLGAFTVDTAKFATVSPGLLLGMGFRAASILLPGCLHFIPAAR